MPQMAPLSWMFMSLSFITALIIFSSLLHSFTTYHNNLEFNSTSKINKSWKW